MRPNRNRLAFGLGTVSGVSMVIDPYGRITAEAAVNARGFGWAKPSLWTRKRFTGALGIGLAGSWCWAFPECWA